MSLILKEVSKQEDNDWVLNDVSFSVGEGEIFGILCAEKTRRNSLIDLIAGIDSADSGKILLDDKELASQTNRIEFFPGSQKKSGLKRIFSTDDEDVSTFKTKIDSFNESLDKVKKVLMLNSPFIGFDEVTFENVAKRITETVREKNLCVIFTTNDYREIIGICDRVGILHGGSLIQVGTPQEIYQNPANVVAASIFGRSNLIPARRLTSNKDNTPEFLTLEGEHRISTALVGKKDLGSINQTITLAIRPENVSISFGASFPEDNVLKARVTGIKFQGSTTLVKLDVGGLSLTSVVLRVVGLNVGDECMVGLPPKKISVLQD